MRVDLEGDRDQRAAPARAGTTAEVMAVVKGDGYGHGMVPAARAALRGGAHLARRVHARRGARPARGRHRPLPVLAWLMAPGLPLDEAVAADVDLSAALDRSAG